MGHIVLATETMRAIELAIEADQGGRYRVLEGQILPHLDDAYRGEDDGFRSHLGASLIGGECARSIWYSFHWVKRARFPARVLRLFNRGHLEEGRIIALFLLIGVQVYQQDENGKQFRISAFGGHFGGSGDGVVIGIPDLPAGMAALLECKTHADKSFQKVKSEGVRSAKFEHYVQMQVYMRKMGLMAALYAAVNKNDDELYMEVVYLDSAIADQFIDRGIRLVQLSEPPKRLNDSPGFYLCKWCDMYDICHKGAAVLPHCRTCHYAVPNEDGTWRCMYGFADTVLTREAQAKGCEHWEKIKGL